MWNDLWLCFSDGHRSKAGATSLVLAFKIMQNVVSNENGGRLWRHGFFLKKSCIRPPAEPWPAQRPWEGRQSPIPHRQSRHHTLLNVWLTSGLMLISVFWGGVRLAQAQTLSDEPALTSSSERTTDTEARIQILTRPTGALVFLQGEYALAGRAPYTITQFLKGPYRIRAAKKGYESSSSDYLFNGNGDDKLTIKLNPKTRLKAFARSLLVPGWGQVYCDQRVKGFLISFTQLGTVGAVIYEDSRYTEALNSYNAAARNLQASQNDLTLQDALRAVFNARKADLDNAYERRRRWLIIAGSVYLYNLLDAVLFFPSYQHSALDISLSISPQPEGNGGGAFGATVGLNVQAKF
jgi:hypothetical protein